MITERLFEDILVKYPELIEDKLKFLGRQVSHYGKRIDLLFDDRFNEKLIIELKIGNLQRNALSQVMEYEGYILSEKDPTARIMIIANRIPLNLKKAMDHHGIEYKEIPLRQLLEFLERSDEQLLNSIMIQPSREIINTKASSRRANMGDTLASALDEIIAKGGSWEKMIEEANYQSLRRGFKTRFTKGTINAHIKYREQRDPDYLKRNPDSVTVKASRTLMGVEFNYSGSLDDELTIYKNTDIKISKFIIDFIKQEIELKSPILMGANRDNPPLNSIGKSLLDQRLSPQNSSYVIPLLIEEGFCLANDRRPFIITKV